MPSPLTADFDVEQVLTTIPLPGKIKLLAGLVSAFTFSLLYQASETIYCRDGGTQNLSRRQAFRP